MAAVAREAIAAAAAKQAKKEAGLAAQAAAASDSRQRSDLEAALKNEAHKGKQLADMAAQLEALMAGGWAVCVRGRQEPLLMHCR